MKRPLLLFSLSLIAGILVAYAGNSLFLIISSILLLISVVFPVSRKFPDMSYIFIGILLFYSIGALEFKYINDANSSKFEEFSNQNVTITGFIDSEPDIRDTKVLYTIRTNEIAVFNTSKKVSGRILLTTLKGSGQSIYWYGREIKIWGNLSIPKGKRNPGGFDYRRYLSGTGTSATIFARQEFITVGAIKKQNLLVNAGLSIRGRVIEVINKSLPKQQAGLLNGMLIGYREGLSKEVQDAFSDSGLTHIMAVSGANVAFIVAPLIFIFKKLHLNQKAANIIVICTLVFFVFITGFEPSVLRAVVMGISVLVGQLLRRESDIYTSISFAALLLLLYNPYNLFNIGFQLSFIATISLVMLYKNIKSIIKSKYLPGGITDILAVTLSAQIGVLPVTALNFNKISIISIVSNLIVVPMVEVITILGTIMAVVGQVSIILSQIVGYFNCILLTLVLLAAKITSSAAFATVRVVTPSILLVLMYYLLTWFFLWYRPIARIKIKFSYIAAFASILIMVVCVQALYPRGLEVVFIDVGEGDSTFIRTSGGKNILIDGGGYNSKIKPETNPGDTVVIPFLLDYGVTKLDLVIATHGHDDHIQGLIPVLKEFKVSRLVMPEYSSDVEFKELIGISDTRRISVSMLQRGDTIKVDNRTYFDIFSPGKGITDNKPSLNNSSLVLKLHYKDISILFTGDIEKEVEDLLTGNNTELAADVLKVAHHGSSTSTGSKFLDNVHPEAAIVSVGKNSFGHPSSDVIERLESCGAYVLRTDESGAVIMKSWGNRIKFKKTVNNQQILD